jgi:GDP-mannose 6-dehydrogenase
MAGLSMRRAIRIWVGASTVCGPPRAAAKGWENRVKIAIFGLGYVGFTAACCMSSQGHSVLGIDVNARKVADILAGISPILEPGVDAMLAEGLRCGLIDAACEADARLGDCDMAIVCVGTPSSADGSHDMRYIVQVTEQITRAAGFAARTGR